MGFQNFGGMRETEYYNMLRIATFRILYFSLSLKRTSEKCSKYSKRMCVNYREIEGSKMLENI